MNILLTGGTGYIGSHTAVVLIEAGHEVVLLDDLSNSTAGVVARIAEIAGKIPTFVMGDVRDRALVVRTLREHAIHAVMHFAGKKAVGESVEQPLMYYATNVAGTISLLEAMGEASVKSLVFSSSATVYGRPNYLPIDERHPTSPTNPYGHSKRHVEQMLEDLAQSSHDWRVACLRYFNPAGAHPSGLIGESPNDIPNNLMPFIAQVAAGHRNAVNIFGNQYDTHDGTGVRDYIHVMDLAEGHSSALAYLTSNPGYQIFNLGTGNGHSVLEMIRAFEEASGVEISFEFTAPRAGDVASCYADAGKAFSSLGWQSSRTLRDICCSAWNFQQQSQKPQHA